jgi:serine/threonine-protein kinase
MTNATDEQRTIALATSPTAQRPPLPSTGPRFPVPRPPRRRGVGLSLRYKLFGAILLLVVLLIGAVLVAVQLRATSVVRRSVDAAMKSTGTIYGALQEEATKKIEGAALQLADDPATKAALGTGDHQTLLDFLVSKKKEAVEADYLMALDARGVLLARTDHPAAVGVDLGSKSPLFSRPLQGNPASGVSSKGGRLDLVVSVPILEGARVAGVLVVAMELSTGFAARVKDVASAEATFLGWTDEGPVVVASTLSKEKAAGLARALAARHDLTDPSLVDGKVVGPAELALGEDPNIVIAVPLVSASGDRLGLFVATRSLELELANFRQIRDTIVAVGFGAILLSLLLSLFLAWQITRPIQALVEATEQVQDGRLDVQIPEAPNDEIGLLTESFAKMLVDLRQKAEMEAYLESMTIRANGTTLSTRPIGDATMTAIPDGTAPQSTTSAPGALFAGRYEILEVLGSGAMGMVYRARDRELEEEVAIKTIRSEALAADPNVVERFKQEIRLARKITNKHVLRTYDFGEGEGVRFITMEYMRGVTLKDLLEQKKALPLGPGLRIARQVCDGLAAAHEVGVIHRDIKPQNMLVNQKGELKLMDFGISRLAGSSTGMTQEGVVIGTPDYMSPEQAEGRPLDHRTDIYSVGVVLWELFCGRLPFQADSALAMVLKQVREEPLAPRKVNPDLPVKLDRIILRAMAKDPSRRYQSISELEEELRGVAG